MYEWVGTGDCRFVVEVGVFSFYLSGGVGLVFLILTRYQPKNLLLVPDNGLFFFSPYICYLLLLFT